MSNRDTETTIYLKTLKLCQEEVARCERAHFATGAATVLVGACAVLPLVTDNIDAFLAMGLATYMAWNCHKLIGQLLSAAKQRVQGIKDMHQIIGVVFNLEEKILELQEKRNAGV